MLRTALAVLLLAFFFACLTVDSQGHEGQGGHGGHGGGGGPQGGHGGQGGGGGHKGNGGKKNKGHHKFKGGQQCSSGFFVFNSTQFPNCSAQAANSANVVLTGGIVKNNTVFSVLPINSTLSLCCKNGGGGGKGDNKNKNSFREVNGTIEICFVPSPPPSHSTAGNSG